MAASSPQGCRGGLLTDGDGRIASAALAISDFSAREFGGAIQSVLKALPTDIRLHVLTDGKTRAQVRGWLEQYRPGSQTDVHEIARDLDFSLWIQDPVLFGSDGTAFLSSCFDRYDDREVAGQLVEAMGCAQVPSPVQVDGGNLIVHGDIVLVSANAHASDADVAALDATRRFVAVGTRLACPVQETLSLIHI